MAGDAQLLVASNRGPLTFSLGPDGELSASRGGGGLVSGLSAMGGDGDGQDALWVCAALSDADRLAVAQAPGGRLDQAGHHTGGLAVRMIDIDPEVFDLAYNQVANRTLWFVNHLLFDIPLAPAFDATAERAWSAYRDYNAAFAGALAQEAGQGATVLVQDYHLTLVPAMLREQRPDLAIGHFLHTPWAPPDYLRVLPDHVAVEVMEGMLGADHAGFLAGRWASAFAECCRVLLGAEVSEGNNEVTHRGRTTRLAVHPLGVDGPGLLARAAEDDVTQQVQALQETVRGRRLVLRVDRTELSKNIVRGIQAFGELLERYPQWRGEVVHLAFAYPSRTEVPEYQAYTLAAQQAADHVNSTFGELGWTPVVLEVRDDFPGALAAYREAEVLVVNPVRDGMNLVAKEGPTLSERGVALVLSREAGACPELGAHALVVNPFDVVATAEAIHAALEMPEQERRERSQKMAAAATALPPAQWLRDQVEALREGR